MGITLAPLACVFFVFFAAFFFGAILIRRGRGAPSLSEPRCAKCNYDLRGFSGTAPVRCSECGADLTQRHAVLWGKHPSNPRRLWLGLAVILVPVLLLPALLLTARHVAVSGMGVNMPGSPGFSSRSNAQVIASLTSSAASPWDWQELDRRLTAGTLNNTEVGQAIDKLIAYLNTTPGNQPLVWADTFFASADRSGKITPAQYERLGKAFHKPVNVSVAGSVRTGAKLLLKLHGSGPWQLPNLEYVYALRQVSVDGSPVDVYSERARKSEKTNPDYLSGKYPNDISGYLAANYPPGKHTLVFTIDIALLSANTAPLAVDNLPGQTAGWPKGRAAWTEVVSVPLNVVPADQSPIPLVTDLSLDPNRTNAVKLAGIRVIREGTGARVTVEPVINGTSVSFSFDVTLRLNGKQYPIGWIVAWPNNSSQNQLFLHLDALDPSLQSADVLLRPNPVHAEGIPGIDRVWGGPVDLLNVPLQRFDLPAK